MADFDWDMGNGGDGFADDTMFGQDPFAQDSNAFGADPFGGVGMGDGFNNEPDFPDEEDVIIVVANATSTFDSWMDNLVMQEYLDSIINGTGINPEWGGEVGSEVASLVNYNNNQTHYGDVQGNYTEEGLHVLIINPAEGVDAKVYDKDGNLVNTNIQDQNGNPMYGDPDSTGGNIPDSLEGGTIVFTHPDGSSVVLEIPIEGSNLA